VVTSSFDVAGTVIGAAVVGVLITLGNAVYRYWLGRTQLKLQQLKLQQLKLEQVAPIILRPRRATGHPDEAGDRTARDLDEAAPATSPGRWWAWLSRRRIGVAVALVIVLAFSLGVITLVELVARQPMSGLTGGDPSGRTSIGSL